MPAIAQSSTNRFGLSTSLFLRLLGLIHFAAFLSFWVQVNGLIGPHGILPASRYLAAVHQQLGSAAYFQLPTLCWIFGADSFLHIVCATGVAASILLFIGVAPAVCLAMLWVSYLSLIGVGQSFLSFQWDALLLETTLLAIWIAPFTFLPRWQRIEPPKIPLLLMWWLLFRLMLLSGVVKLTSADATWRNLSALTFHYETQPLPNPLAWWSHQLPAGLHRSSCALMFVLELTVPFLLFAPRRLRHSAAVLLIGLQLGIAATGNYAFFNFLTIALCLLCLDDGFWSRVLPAKCNVLRDTRLGSRRRRLWLGVVGTSLAAGVVLYTAVLAVPAFERRISLPAFQRLQAWVAPFGSLNNYGLFAMMTTSRPELVFEGSDDARTWRAYEFPYKPGDLARRPRFVAPHQPRLDWQLWFAALMPPEQSPWVLSLCEHLLRGTPDVLGLLGENPFPGHPPRYVRVVRYDYQFTTRAQRRESGLWWRRTPMDLFVPPSSLK